MDRAADVLTVDLVVAADVDRCDRAFIDLEDQHDSLAGRETNGVIAVKCATQRVQTQPRLKRVAS